MHNFTPFSLNLHGRIVEYNRPAIMGILNITPDSFFQGSRTPFPTDIATRVYSMMEAGVDIIDIGGCSTRPGFTPVEPEEEWRRVEAGLKVVREISPDIPVSIDTYNAPVAAKSIEAGADIINDISAFTLDPKLRDVVESLKVPYILTHPTDSGLLPDMTGDHAMQSALGMLSREVERLTLAGVSDVIIDPGFGFGKTLSQNFDLMARLKDFEVLGRPLLVGISRKSMIFRALGTTPDQSLNGTTVLNTFALLNGASIIRVHDVAEAREAVTLTGLLAEACLTTSLPHSSISGYPAPDLSPTPTGQSSYSSQL